MTREEKDALQVTRINFYKGDSVKLIRPAMSAYGPLMPIGEDGIVDSDVGEDGIVRVYFKRFATWIYADSTYVRHLYLSEVLPESTATQSAPDTDASPMLASEIQPS